MSHGDRSGRPRGTFVVGSRSDRAAELVLVHGRSLRAAARAVGISHKAVGDAVAARRRACTQGGVR